MIFAHLLGLIGLGYFALSTKSCKNPTTTTTPVVCECEDKEHLGVGEKCCDIKGCKCELKVYGTLDNGVKIHKKAGVDSEKAEALAKLAEGTYANHLDPIDKQVFDDHITEIHIVPGNHNQTFRRGKILELGVDISISWLRTYFEDVTVVQEAPEVVPTKGFTSQRCQSLFINVRPLPDA